MNIRSRKVLFIGSIVGCLVFLTGCGALETLVNKNSAASSIGDLLNSGDKSSSTQSTVPANYPASSPAESTTGKLINLYFADSSGKYLVREQRILPSTEGLARETINQWLKGPVLKSAAEQAAVPVNTLLRDINIKNNVAIVDLSGEFLRPNPKVSPEVALYGLVNTLTQFSTIKEVQLRIDGSPLRKYGTIDASSLGYNSALVKPSSSGSSIIPNNPGASNPVSIRTGSGNAASNSGNNLNNTNNSTNNASPKPSPSSINLFDYQPS